jgi:hypothetical protein
MAVAAIVKSERNRTNKSSAAPQALRDFQYRPFAESQFVFCF